MKTHVVTNRSHSYYDEFDIAITSLEELTNTLAAIESVSFQVVGDDLSSIRANCYVAIIATASDTFIIDLETVEPRPIYKLLQDKLIILYDGKFTVSQMMIRGIVPKNPYDLMLSAMVATGVDKKLDYSYPALLKKHTDISKEDLAAIATVDFMSPLEADGTNAYVKGMEHMLKLYDALIELNLSNETFRAVSLENSALPVVSYMEICGMRLDKDAWRRLYRRLQFEEGFYWYKLVSMTRDNLLPELYDRFGDPKYDSPDSAIQILKAHGVSTFDPIKRKDSASSEQLSKSKVPIADAFTKWSKAKKRVNSYSLKWLDYCLPSTGRIHTLFQQIISTGRMSAGKTSSGPYPNLLSIPKEEQFRNCFIPADNCKIIIGDYQGQETVIMADQSKEPGMMNFFRVGKGDFHSYVARLVFIELLHDKTDEQIKAEFSEYREQTKGVTFTISYGGTYETIARRNDITIREAKAIFENYDKSFPKLGEHFNRQYNQFIGDGFITINKVSRRIRALDIKPGVKKSDRLRRICMNTPIQGTAADIIKTALILLFKYTVEEGLLFKVKIILQCYDEIVIEVPNELAELMAEVLKSCMVKAGDLFLDDLSIKIEPVISDSWLR